MEATAAVSTPAATPSTPSSAPAATSTAPTEAPRTATGSTPEGGPVSAALADAAPATPKPASEPRRYKVKVDGQEQEVEEAELLRGYQRASAAAKRLEEAARLRKEIEEKQAAQAKRYEDPRIRDLIAKNPGMTPDDAAALVRVQELYERDQMTPEQRAVAEERKKREEIEQKLKERDEAESKAKLHAETQAEAAKLDRELSEAASKHGIPKNPAWGRMMLDHMAAVIRAGGVPDVHEAAAFVKENVQRSDRQRLAALSDPDLVGWLGKDIYDRIRKHSVAEARGQVTTPTPAPAPILEPSQPRKWAMTPEEWRKANA